MPMVNPVILAGANLLIALNPTGLTNISPIACRKYIAASQAGLTKTPLCLKSRKYHYAPTKGHKSRPIANLTIFEIFPSPIRLQKKANIGARQIMYIGFND